MASRNACVVSVVGRVLNVPRGLVCKCELTVDTNAENVCSFTRLIKLGMPSNMEKLAPASSPS